MTPISRPFDTHLTPVSRPFSPVCHPQAKLFAEESLGALPSKLHWRVHLIEDDETVNAFALPNGHIYVFTGVLKATPSLDLRSSG